MKNSFETLFKDWRFWICAGFICLMIILAVFAPHFTPYKYDKMDMRAQLKSPSMEHIMGTDEFGRDVWTRVIYGGRLTFQIVFGAVAISMTFGSLFGMIAGFMGGWIEMAIMRFVDFIMTFPQVLLSMFVITFVGPSVGSVIFVIGFLGIARFARLAYASTLSVKKNEYVEASRVCGASTIRIIFIDILPNIWTTLLVQVSLSLGNAMLTESSLSYLGLGPQPNVPSWGRSISDAISYMNVNVSCLLFPAAVLSLTILAFSILGDAVRDSFDPRLRKR